MDFLLVFIELFSLGVMAEALRVNIGSKSAISLQREPVDPKFQVEKVAPTNYSSSQKTRLNDLSYGIKICLQYCISLPDFSTIGQGMSELLMILQSFSAHLSAMSGIASFSQSNGPNYAN